MSIILFPLTEILGISLSVVLGSKEGEKIWFTLGVMFSAGILLANGLVHALPHASMAFEEMQSVRSTDTHSREHGQRLQEDSHDDHGDFPWANMIFGATWMLFVMIEAFMERAIDNYLDSQVTIAGCHGNKLKKTGNGTEMKSEHIQPIEECIAGKVPDQEVGEDSINCPLQKSSRHSTYLVTDKRPSVVGTIHHQTFVEDVDEKQTMNPWVAVLLLVVMSIHVILEGLAIGSSSDVSTIISLFIGIILHRGFGAFALGSSFITSGYWDKNRPGGRKMFYIMSLVYIAMDVIGIAIGWGIGTTFGEESYGEAVISSMLGGSFLFVAASELIPGQLEKTRVHKFPVVPVMFSMLVGFAAMASFSVVGH